MDGVLWSKEQDQGIYISRDEVSVGTEAKYVLFVVIFVLAVVLGGLGKRGCVCFVCSLRASVHRSVPDKFYNRFQNPAEPRFR